MKIQKVLLLAGIGASLLLASCNNFMQSSFLKNELEEIIKDASVERMEISVFALNAYGTLTGETGGTYKMGTENLTLGFTENKGWQFVEWKVTDADGNKTGCSLSDKIYIKNPLSSKTTFSINGSAGGYKIEAVCMARPNVEVASPAYLANGVNQDSPIEITFSQAVSEENFIYSKQEFESYGPSAKAIRNDSNDPNSDIVAINLAGEVFFKNITIEDSNGSNIAAHYKAPVLSADKKKITLYADTSKVFDFSNATVKDIFVTVSSKVSYDYQTQNEKTIKIIPDKAYDFNYKVSASTTAKAKITFSVKNDEDKVVGTLNYSGEQEFNIGQSIKLEFEPNNEFEFVGWDVLGNQDNAVSVKADDRTLIVNVFKSTDTVKIVPVCREKGVAEITVYTKVGSVEHSEPRKLIVGEEFSVTINHDSLYYFPGWKIRNLVVDEILSDEDRNMYFYSEDWSKETTTIKVVKECSNLAVEGGVYYKPRIIQHVPVDSTEGINRVQSIKVYFDKEIESNSLFYTDNERKEIEKRYANVTWLKYSSKSYAYKLNNNDDTLHYKNLTLEDYNNGTNLTKYYARPYLEPNGKTMIIPVNKTYKSDGKLNDTTLPPGNTVISVKIEADLNGSDFTHLENGISIPLERGNDSWIYTTNGGLDTEGPKIESSVIKAKNFTLGNTKPNNFNEYKNVYLDDNSLTSSVTVTDKSKNLANIYLRYQKILDENYVDAASGKGDADYDGQYKLTFTKDSQDVTKYIVSNDKWNVSKRDSGLYKWWIYAEDEVNNSDRTDFYYALIDNKGPGTTIDVSTFKYFRDSSKIMFCDWVISNTHDDYDSTTLYITPSETGVETAYPMDDKNEYVFEGYQVKVRIVSKDVFGNETQFYMKDIGFGGYQSGIANNDYFYSNGWFSPNFYSDKEKLGNVLVFANTSSRDFAYVFYDRKAESLTKSKVQEKLSQLNNEMPAALKGKYTWNCPQEEIGDRLGYNQVKTITGVDPKTNYGGYGDNNFWISNGTDLGFAYYKNSKSPDYKYEGPYYTYSTGSTQGYFIPVIKLW